jgi:hypothetical protein
MSDSRNRLLSSDAWLLSAIYGATLGGDPTLSRVIGTGDFVNHAIFTLAELNGGLSRLQKNDYIHIQDGMYRLTRKGEEATTIDPAARKGIWHHLETVRNRIGAPDWGPRTDPNAAGDPQNPMVYVSEEMYQEAIKEHRRSFSKKSAPDKIRKC